MSYPASDRDKDNDIHIISRDSSDYPQPEGLDTPNFISGLDLPTPSNGDTSFFDQFNDTHQPQSSHNEQNFNDLHIPTGLSPMPEYAHPGEAKDSYNSNSMAGALTKIPHNLPPLPQLSEPVIPNNIPLSGPSVIPDYLQSNTNNRAQPLITMGKKKKESSTPKTRPAFVMKIWSMVNDPKNHDYIRWNDDGESFQVVHREDFMKTILPKYFKHNNFASFVRQLNMYGWHKVQDVNSGSMKDDRNQDEVLQFKNPYFIRGREDLLDNIVRNKTGSSEDSSDLNMMNIQLVMGELDQIKMNQLAIMEDMRRMRKDNQVLWNESFTARERHQKQTQTLEKIMKFLAAVYGNSAGKIFEVEDGAFNNNQVSTYNNSPTPSNYNSPAPISKPRLMLMDQAYQKQGSSNGRSPSAASTGGSIEEIVRNTPDMSQHSDANANKIYNQIMNPDSNGVASPSQYFPELSNSYFSQQQNSKTPQDPDLKEEELSGLEQNIYRQGQALSQVQDWIQALASKQQQQQEQIHQQQKQQQSQEGSPRLDDFDVDEFLNNNSNAASGQRAPMHANDSTPSASKRVIEEVDDSDNGASKKTKTK